MTKLAGRRPPAGGSSAVTSAPDRDSLELWVPIALFSYALLAGTYFVVRYGGRWAENDSANLTRAIRAVVASGTIIPPSGDLYANGYAYAAISAVLLTLTGLNPPMLVQVVYPVVTALLMLPAWALYRELLGSRAAAMLSALLLFMQPEFMFVVLRGSHERVLRTFMLVALWMLVRSFRFHDRPGYFMAHVVFFYLAAFGLIATNVIFGISFIMAIATAMAIGWALGRWSSSFSALASGVAGRLALVALSVTVLGFIVMFYLYPPASFTLRAFRELGQNLVNLFVTTEVESNPYTAVALGWSSLEVYFLLSMGDYLLLVGSAVAWLWQGWSWLRRPSSPPALAAWLLWLLYGAFAFQGAIAIASDLTGSLLGTNLQHRSFPSFAMIATAMVAVPLSRLRLAGWAKVLPGGALALLAGLGLLKVTNEPSLSSKWMFYTPAEVRVLEWADQHLEDTTIWVGLDERLSAAFELEIGKSTQNNQWDIYAPKPFTRSFVISDINRLQSARIDRTLPPTARANRVYDGGTTQLYRARPLSPYQR